MPTIEFIEKLGPTIVSILALLGMYWSTKRQILSATVTASRIKWIDSLREDLAKFVALTTYTSGDVSLHNHDPNYEDKEHERAIIGYRVSLMLNAKNPLQQQLLAAINDFNRWSLTADENAAYGNFKAIIDASRNVINAEWSKVEQGR